VAAANFQVLFWDQGGDVLTKEQALQSVIVGDTLDGDELIIRPDASERAYVLPRHSEGIYVAGDGLPEAFVRLTPARPAC
jgi:hypothetical protein